MIELADADGTFDTTEMKAPGESIYPELRGEMHRLLESMTIGGAGGGSYEGWNGRALRAGMPTPFQVWPASAASDVTESETEYRLRLDLPGVDPESVGLSVSGDHLHIEAQPVAPETGDDAPTIRSGGPGGNIVCSLRLPFEMDRRDIEAMLHDGVLELAIAKPDAPGNVVEIPLPAA